MRFKRIKTMGRWWGRCLGWLLGWWKSPIESRHRSLYTQTNMKHTKLSKTVAFKSATEAPFGRTERASNLYTRSLSLLTCHTHLIGFLRYWRRVTLWWDTHNHGGLPARPPKHSALHCNGVRGSQWRTSKRFSFHSHKCSGCSTGCYKSCSHCS